MSSSSSSTPAVSLQELEQTKLLQPSQPMLLTKLDEYVLAIPNKIAYSFLDDSGDIIDSITYQDLSSASYSVALSLYKASAQVGDRVLLVYPPSLDYIISFLGCLRAGVIAVPMFPPNPNKLNKDVLMFRNIAVDSGAKIALTSSLYNYATKLTTIRNLLLGTNIDWPELSWIITDDDCKTKGEIKLQISTWFGMSSSTIRFPKIDHNYIAFLQYTSGSTSDPKGVQISHGNLQHNLTLITTGLGAVEDTVVVSWLPQYHDMGLIGSYLGVLYCGGCGYYMSPLSFIRNPTLWVHAISKYRATHMQAPNFAYPLCARKFLIQTRLGKGSDNMDASSLDLSCVRHMINAAEPVEAAAIDIFYGVFSKFGLPHGIIFPTYGLAEHTVYVCSNGKQRIIVDKKKIEERVVHIIDSRSNEYRSNESVVMVGCGCPAESSGVSLKIVNESNLPVPEDCIGEIWISSPSCARGYWNMPEKSKQDFNGIVYTHVSAATAAPSDDTIRDAVDSASAVLTEDELDDKCGRRMHYLKTGDLGFLHNGELFVCGRVKDLIIIRGRNHYPQDIERECENSLNGQLRGGCSAAFSINLYGDELLVYVAEISTDSVDANELVISIKTAVNVMHGLTVSAVVLVRSHTIAKTTSGKISRQAVKKAYLDGKLDVVCEWSNVYSNDLSDELYIEKVGQVNKRNVGSTADCSDAVDPTGKSFEDVLSILQAAIAACTGAIDSKAVPTDLPLSAIGMDSVKGIQLQTILEQKFTIQLPEELLFEADATLRTICTCLVTGGVMRNRPIMVNAWELLAEVRKQVKPVKGALPLQWFKVNATKANVDTLTFKDSCAAASAPLTTVQELVFLLATVYIFGNFLLTPLAIAALFLYTPVETACTCVVILLCCIYLLPWYHFPPAFRRTYTFECLLRYFSYRVVVEKKVDHAAAPVLYAMGPHGVFALAPVIQSMLNEFIMGDNFNIMAAPAVFYVPGYNVICKLLGFKTVDEACLKATLGAGHAVGLVPGGIAEMFHSGRHDGDVLSIKNRKGFIRIALQTGAQILPCYNFGNSQTFQCSDNKLLKSISSSLRVSLIVFWGRLGLPIPNRVPIMTVIGRPIMCPKILDPSPELINEYHLTYLKEMRRIFEKYKSAYGWSGKTLTIST